MEASLDSSVLPLALDEHLELSAVTQLVKKEDAQLQVTQLRKSLEGPGRATLCFSSSFSSAVRVLLQ